MEILAVIVMICMAVTSGGPAKTPVKVESRPEEPNKYADRPYGKVSYLEDM